MVSLGFRDFAGQVADAETFTAQAKNVALELVGGSLGVGFSNADRDFIEAQVASLGNTPEGNRRLIDLMTAIADRKIAVAKIASRYARDAGGNLDFDFVEFMDNWSKQNPFQIPGVQSGSSDEQAAATQNILQKLGAQ